MSASASLPSEDDRAARPRGRARSRGARHIRDRERIALDRRRVGAPHRSPSGRVRPTDRNDRSADRRGVTTVLRRSDSLLVVVAVVAPRRRSHTSPSSRASGSPARSRAWSSAFRTRATTPRRRRSAFSSPRTSPRPASSHTHRASARSRWSRWLSRSRTYRADRHGHMDMRARRSRWSSTSSGSASRSRRTPRGRRDPLPDGPDLLGRRGREWIDPDEEAESPAPRITVVAPRRRGGRSAGRDDHRGGSAGAGRELGR